MYLLYLFILFFSLFLFLFLFYFYLFFFLKFSVPKERLISFKKKHFFNYSVFIYFYSELYKSAIFYNRLKLKCDLII
ncbi:hypothetical protein GLOIN_2v29537 [Rhizophagus irregularis DAOM 181602=DAOM 197198]|uniref:Uncharacterized protein n=1 Tax=Rhizophagus irregularis (strain DAOM 181602 / DAOM 197198 / MUCL 43194) TaxID=747089 RepID=A0A2P4Q2S5_RHIID|nr:hypothetical protein GLOIN_2v29537 [Rhizophagus irregularis DAOM 181602=DAOM 197198]POG71953.1 hypothetical protein GLOIN_2v29537 [Rhizophagus irregularis DAOM 181602=DAOM 197198]GET51489.1 hypothetical protein GLOIN_2v29537 [Rhizophagus irregularis DAOM 181602=DAOM 197198]|eukprot:XP_025178819.1 hypothetical protein GLOIN_2v29537 [Rhizophagus irregularis DAOM 181602=DAOM 197198]